LGKYLIIIQSRTWQDSGGGETHLLYANSSSCECRRLAIGPKLHLWHYSL